MERGRVALAVIPSIKGSFVAVLVLPKPLWERVVAHCLDCMPLEACGLLAGTEHAPGGGVTDTARAGVMKVGTLNAQGRQSAGGVASRGPDAAVEVVRAFTGVGVAEVREVYPATNAARSARVYTVEPKDLLRSDREAERAGLSLIGVWHSHTHTPAYPSPTDIAQAPDPFWHYVLVSLSDTDPVLRSYRIVGGEVTEEQVLAVGM